MALSATAITLWVLHGIFILAGSEVLTPPYFNLAKGRRITATSTCGDGVDEPELFCKLVGANSDKSTQFSVIQGQLCDHCIPSEHLQHPAENAIDGSERWWQSPPLSRGMNYNAVNVTIDLGQLFQVAYIIIKMGNSPRPGVWVLERSVDNGVNYSPWQYFADNQGDCEKFFGKRSLNKIASDDDVICTTQFSKVVPLEGGEIVVSLLNDRPSAKDFFNSTALQEFTRATNIRLRLLRTKTLLGHLMSVARRDPTVTRRYFYAIKDISIGGRCVCNGHAAICDIADPNDPYKLQCRCEHNTCGSQCGKCCRGFIQKKWKSASYTKFFACEPCNCFGHSSECIYDEEIDLRRESLDIYGQFEGGGVCQNCQHYTQGINCNECVRKYYRPRFKMPNDTDACWPCDCNGPRYTGDCADGFGQCECKIEFLPPACDACNHGYYDFPNCKECDCHKEGTERGICEVGGGQCPCKYNFIGKNCDRCDAGYYNFPECSPCQCDIQGSLDNVCDVQNGQCSCLNNYGGRDCSRCEHGYFDFSSNCTFCNCDVRGAQEEICDKNTGDCLCKEGYGSKRCDSNAPGYWSYPQARHCGCHEAGSSSTFCDASGYCPCIVGFSGRTCDQCSPGFYDFPDCKPCHCDQAGSIGISCDSEGRCQCKYNFDGIHCDQCRKEFYNFPLCEECNCDPAGVLETFLGCGNAPVGELCECKDRVTGRICNDCRPLYWNLQQSNALGCQDCNCNTPGTIGALASCESKTGQCNCKPHVTSHSCDECKDGFFSLMEDNLFGCDDCKCNIGGSESTICDKTTGKCQCRHRIEGQRCDQPMKLHYFPTLYQLKYEAEDGRTPQNTPVRFGYDEAKFPGYSWRGYAVYSELQKKTLYDIYINKPTLYRILFYYRNPSTQTIKGEVEITPHNPQDDIQTMKVNFEPTSQPELMTVSTVPGIFSPLVINPGYWTFSIEATANLFLDYFVLLPLPYYEATILSEVITTRCHMASEDQPCLHFSYPLVDKFDLIFGSAGYVNKDGLRTSVETFSDETILDKLESKQMAWLSNNQPQIQFDLRLRKAGPYVILINYFTPEGSRATSISVSANTQTGQQNGRAMLYDCTFTWACRQVVTNLQGEVAVFEFDTNFINIIAELQGDSGEDFAIHSVNLVPLEQWHMDMIKPRPVCTKLGRNCFPSTYPSPPESAKEEFENNLEGKRAPKAPTGVDSSVHLVYLNETDKMVDLTGRLRSAGKYVFLVHYHQPNHPAFKMDVLVQNGNFYEATLPLKHCPNVNGCRAVLKHMTDGSPIFDILENYILSLKIGDNKEVWLDYLLVVPEDHFSERFLKEQPRDKTIEFFEKCGQNHFFVDPSETGFCREAAFALTAEYNNGALPCHCDAKGSHSFECDVFGGQCDCRPNVIGRQCNQCKTGFFGFPDCRVCDCPSTALCDQFTGECICPPRVIGDRCERCEPNTYGFDPIIGCEQCRCNNVGVDKNELQCELTTGQCNCRTNVVGRRCERCTTGYWGFPYCQLCNCDVRGVEANICNQDDGSCFCKANTHGPGCELCSRGTFHLQELNPDGCTQCFCFGKSQICSSSTYFTAKITTLQNWKALNIRVTEEEARILSPSPEPQEYADLLLLDLNSFTEPEKDGFLYFAASEDYLGNKIKSYGGTFSFQLLIIFNEGAAELATADIILMGNNVTALHSFYDSRTENGQLKEISVILTERDFKTLEGQHMKREQFMMLLHNVEGLFIRAQYASNSAEARLSNITMDIATRETQSEDFRQALGVEQCQCPPNYEGSSCENCARGYFRTEAGPYGGYCIPCQCNNHAGDCDPVTGRCLNCQDNTVGDNCELCGAGYFGDPTRGTQNDCLICSCPLPSISNNFALSCTHDFTYGREDRLYCECKTGYMGKQCEHCSPGYYGQPFVQGDYCRPCECSGNIDVSSQFSCDNINGVCLECLNNSYGSNCERCAPGYYGDAITLKNCQGCSCDDCGNKNCQHFTGVCECHPNVVGDKCDQCAADHWGFASCQGCYSCNCAEASESSQCDGETGQCPCRPGVTGQRCDQCNPGFWQYTPYGCTECECKEGFRIGVGCDPLTGHCSCLPGVLGDNCEGCPHRWILIDGVGCNECDDCVHALLDSTDDLHDLILPVIGEFETAAQSFFLHKRLQVFNGSVIELTPKVDALDFSEDKLSPIEDVLNSLEEDTLAVSTKIEVVHKSASDSSANGESVKKQAEEVLANAREGANLAEEVVSEINVLVIGLETGTGHRIEQAIAAAEDILQTMNFVHFSERSNEVDTDFEMATEFLDRIQHLSLPVKANKEDVDEVASRLNVLQEKLKDLQGRIKTSQQQTHDVQAMNSASNVYGIGNVQNKYEEVGRLRDITDMHITEAENYTSAAAANLEKARNNYNFIANDLRNLKRENEKLNGSVTYLSGNLDSLYRNTAEAMDHSQQLRMRADKLDDLLSDTRQVTENALAAANAYNEIVLAIDSAEEAANDARNASRRAVELSSGVTDDAYRSRQSSEDKYREAKYTTTEVENVLIPQLNTAKAGVDDLNNMMEVISTTSNEIDSMLSSVNTAPVAAEATNLQEKATEAEEEAVNVNNQVEDRHNTLQQYAQDARGLSQNIEQAKRDSKLALDQIKIVRDSIPGMKDSARDLLVKKQDIQDRARDIEERLARLRRTITKTREQTNKIKVGVDFKPGSVLELKNPDDLSDFATATEISFFLQTYETSGLPFFLGTPDRGSSLLPSASTDDFIAVEVNRGYVRLITKLGKYAYSITNSKYIADGQWHKISIKRVGKVIKLSVHSESSDGTEEVVEADKVLPGIYSILNLDQKVSKLYIGGIPPGVNVNQSFETHHYVGQMEDLLINNRPIGMWNFVRRGPPEIPLNGALERDILKKLSSEGLRFDGTGYVSLDTNNLQIYESFSIRLSFKTLAENGLLFLLANGQFEVVSIELREGKVLYQHIFKSTRLILTSENVYNDHNWHTIEATKSLGSALIKIDNEDSHQGEGDGEQIDFSETPNVVYFGGYPSDHSFNGVTNDDFRGCIQNVEIAGQSIDFLKSKDSIGTLLGCPYQVANLVSFYREDPGYVKLASPIRRGLQLVFKFKTQYPNGLIFFTETKDRSIYLSLSLAEGALVLRSAPGGEITTGSYSEYNDSAWHFVIATREDNKLGLIIDDRQQFTVELIQESVPFDGPVFFGGIPDNYRIDAAAAAVDTNFYGCIGDVTLNDEIVNFATAAKSERPGAMLETCSLTKEFTSLSVDPDTHLGPSIDAKYPSVTPRSEAVKTSPPSTESELIEPVTPALESCVLPIVPKEDDTITVDNGARFGYKRDSRIEYDQLPDNIRGNFSLSVDFKSDTQEGILFYCSNINHRDFSTIYMKDGRIVFSFNAGSGAAMMRTKQPYNDNKWHKLVASKVNNIGRIEIDGEIVANGMSKGSAKHIEHSPPYFFGGLNNTIVELAGVNTEKTDLSFSGCLRGFRMNNKVVGGTRRVIGVNKCSYEVENGVFFKEGTRSHIVVRPRFNVGVQFSMSMEVKPRRNSGVLMSVHGKRDFILLQLNDGTVEFKIDNGKEIVTASYSLSNQFLICDGRWHSIQVIKNKNLAILIVDGVSATPASGPAGTNSADTHNPLFLGSQPRLHKRRGNAVTEKYVGCMKNVILNDKKVELPYTLFVGTVDAGVCPLI